MSADADQSLDAFGWPVEKNQLDILGEQYFVAMFGGGYDAWNFIRRTGHPRTLTRSLAAPSESGPFPRTGTYPSGEISANLISYKDKIIIPLSSGIMELQILLTNKNRNYEKYIWYYFFQF